MSILARNAKEVTDLYPEDSRYFIARSIGLCWFEYLSQMQESTLNALKEELHDKTFVGDYVGKSQLLNFIKYPKEAIIFHSVVPNQRQPSTAARNAYCLVNSIQIIQDFGLDVLPN